MCFPAGFLYIPNIPFIISFVSNAIFVFLSQSDGFVHRGSLVIPSRHHISPEILAFLSVFLSAWKLFSPPVSIPCSHQGIINIFLTKRAKLDMLNEFVSLVISSNEQHRKLMERLALLEKPLPVALIEIPIFNKQGKTEWQGSQNGGG